MNGPSKNLSWKELACKDGTAYPNEFRVDGRIFILADAFEKIRYIYNKPIKILSAYRTEEHNKKINGAKNSQHIQGKALDLMPPEGITVDQFYKTIRDNVVNFGIHGLGRYTTFVHVDIRESDTVAYWSGTGVKDS